MLKPDNLPLGSPSRPRGFEDRYRLYIDESGDHVYRDLTEIAHRYLCLLGCWFRNPEYAKFHKALEELKTKHLPHHPDDPVVLHREDMINMRGIFKVFQDDTRRAQFDAELLDVIRVADFRIVAVVIDKAALRNLYGDTASHPYHLGLGFMLQRYAGYLNHINRVGDVMAEARGGIENRLLAESYERVYVRGIWGVTSASYFQSALPSKEIKLKSKAANIAGLQLSDLLAHPVRMWVLRHYGLSQDNLGAFAKRLIDITESKFNRQLYDGRLEGYGTVLYPNPRK